MKDSELIARLRELADRCEAATGPDWTISKAIAEALGWREVLAEDIGEEPGYVWEQPNGNRHVWPDFTKSLDAALTLVPEGWEFIKLEQQRSWPNDPRGDCMLLEATVMELRGQGYSKTTALTGPLAICAATLRARAQEEERK